MGTNIEIKANAADWQSTKAVAERLSGGRSELIHQEDTFFSVPRGRLKLRMFSEASGELIYYERADVEGPKQSQYLISRTTEPATLRETLEAALGVRGVVRKKRHLYLVGRTRIHLDEVEELGTFVELEVVLRSGQPPAEGEAIARDLMEHLGIRDEDLIDKAYVDLLKL